MNALQKLMDMSGRRVLITGANGYLGRNVADTLAEMGAELVLVDRHESDFNEIADTLSKKWGVPVGYLRCNLELESERLALIEAIKADAKGLNVLVNGAAFVGSSDLKGWSTSFGEQTIDTWRRAIEVNLTAAFHLSQAFATVLSNADGGNIINVSSIYGRFGPDWRLYEGTDMANPAAYSVSKGGLEQLTRWLATTMAPNVRVNAISPGGIYRKQRHEFVERYVDKTPLARMAVEDDFRGAFAYLASDMSRFVTGQILRVDGGWGVW